MLNRRKVIVTDAASGIGKAIVMQLMNAMLYIRISWM